MTLKRGLWVIIFHIMYMAPLLMCTDVSSTEIKLRVVTWNVADNGYMDGSFTDAAIDNVLGLKNSDTPSIYAIGLQENCWQCDEDNLHFLAKRFLNRILKVAVNRYGVAGIYGTRMSNWCETECKRLGNHGTTAIILISKVSLGASGTAVMHNKGCSSKFYPNKEKGISGIKVQLKGGETLCFASSHLDSDKSWYRRNCVKEFFNTANGLVDWSNSCHAQFIFGDFNTRTGDKTGGASHGKFVSKTTNFENLRKKDELSGIDPYGKDSYWDSNLLTYINTLTPKKFQECQLTFMPTYSIKNAKEFCGGKFPCYRTNRPLSWTDRILYTTGKCLEYNAVYEEYGDHFPVFADFVVNLY